MRKMRTAEEMYEYYCKSKPEGKNTLKMLFTKANESARFEKIEALLEPEEYCVMIIDGYIYIYISRYRREKYGRMR